MTDTDVTVCEQATHDTGLRNKIETPTTILNAPLRLVGLLVVFAVAILPLLLSSVLVSRAPLVRPIGTGSVPPPARQA